MSILLVFAYVLEFEKQLPIIESIEDIKDKVLRYEKDIHEKIFKINIGLILPNVIFSVFSTLDNFWFMVDSIENKYYDLARYNGFFTFFSFLFTLTFLLPPVYFTHVMKKFVSSLDTTFCGEDTAGILSWLKDKELGWKVFSAEMSPKLLKRIVYVVGVGILTGLARVLE